MSYLCGIFKFVLTKSSIKVTMNIKPGCVCNTASLVKLGVNICIVNRPTPILLHTTCECGSLKPSFCPLFFHNPASSCLVLERCRVSSLRRRRYVCGNFHKLRWKCGGEPGSCFHLKISLLIDLFCLPHPPIALRRKTSFIL